MRIDRTIGMGLAMTILLQTGGAMMWAGAANARLAELEVEIQIAFDVNQRLARLEGETSMMREQLGRIESHLVREVTDED